MTMPHQLLKRFWQQNLAVKLTAIQAVVAIFIIASTFWVLLGIAQQRQATQQSDHNLQLGHLVVSELNAVTFQISALVQMMATTAELYQNAPQTLAISVPALLAMESQQTLIVGGGIWPSQRDKNHQSIFYARDKDNQLTIIDDYNQENAKDYRLEPWYLAASIMPRGKVYWSPSYRDIYTHEPMITASAPIWSEHQLIGVATVDLSLKGLSQYINNQLANQAGYVLLVDHFQQLIAMPPMLLEDASMITNLSQLSARYPAFDKVEDQISQLHQTLMTAPIPSASQQLFNRTFNHFEQEQQVSLSHHLAWHLGAINHINPSVQFDLTKDPLFKEPASVSVLMMPDTHWQVVTLTPNSTLAGEARSIIDQVGLSLIAIQIIALISLFMALHKVLVVPLHHLVKALTEGRNEEIEISGNRPDELGTLARALVGQTQQLDKAIASLAASHTALEEELAVHQELQASFMAGYQNHLSLMQSAEILYSVKRLSGEHIALNAGLCQLLGQHQQHMLGLTNQALYPAAIAKIEDRQDQRLKDTNHLVSYSLAIDSYGNHLRYHACKLFVKDDQGDEIAILTLAIKAH
ncbi:cache domain-containing protein [Shewanella sp. NIFS-20-20]|uniref:cache domain-containing protein n=1 Tax=Shewanella sp. NIFS-20-20 TaxID=2853806 RepID=UPI001C48BC24|nr:cache domain-containing protein [Shewanella sp. NIFS-20-20]MBV7314383.1 cache domain-containing protein [Shewanella sp. NIFS-20-20]